MSDKEAAIQIEMMDGSSKPYVPLAELAATREALNAEKDAHSRTVANAIRVTEDAAEREANLREDVESLGRAVVGLEQEGDKLREALRREIERRLVEYEGWAGTLDHAVTEELDAALADGGGEDKKINYRDLIEKLTEGRYDMECDCCRDTAKILSEGGLW